MEMGRALQAGLGEASGVALAAEILRRYQALERLRSRSILPRAGRRARARSRAGARGDHGELRFGQRRSRGERNPFRVGAAPSGAVQAAQSRAGRHRGARRDARRFARRSSTRTRRSPSSIAIFCICSIRGSIAVFSCLRRIDWSSPATVLERIIRYEAVHEIGDWDELRRRIDPADRRCYAFFHPQLIDEPLIFVEVALTLGRADGDRAAARGKARACRSRDKARVASFYSISNCQGGLAGINVGNFLIKQVVEEIRRELPLIETFVTLSPVPGFRAWLETSEDPAIAPLKSAALELGTQENWPSARDVAARLRAALEPLAAHYLLKARRPDGRVMDPVARFHLGNGASLERLDWEGDLSPKGLARVARDHGQLSLRPRRDEAQWRGAYHQPRPDRRVERGEEARSFRRLAPALRSTGSLAVGRLERRRPCGDQGRASRTMLNGVSVALRTGQSAA